MRVMVAPAVLFLVACAGGGRTGERAPLPAVDAATVVVVPPDAAVPAPPPPPPPPDAAAACQADQQHCCMPDGSIVGLGRCQPVNRAGDLPAMKRLADGTCERIKCMVRCLPALARIGTPRGEVAVSRLEVGDEVWTLDADGHRVAMPVVRVASVAAPQHTLAEIRLDDGRVIRASAGHPTREGRALGDLAIGDRVDGARVIGVAAVAYDGERTWDLLPAGATGVYWADGVLLGSTLFGSTLLGSTLAP